MNCMLAMQAAGIPGPYFPHTNVYSKQCFLTLGLIAKPALFAASDAAKRGAPWAATRLGFGEAASATIGCVAGVIAAAIWRLIWPWTGLRTDVVFLGVISIGVIIIWWVKRRAG
jgi:hypothetical protein